MSVEAFIPYVDFLNRPVQDIYAIGPSLDEGVPAIPGIAAAVGYKLDPVPNEANLGGLIQAVGPAKELQANIADLQAKLGTSQDVREQLVGWVEESGLLRPVERSYMLPELQLPNGPVVGVMTGGVARWMKRRAEVLIAMGDESETPGITDYFHSVVLAAGNRPMKHAEGDDARGTESDYMEEVIKPMLDEWHIPTELVSVDDGRGDVVMDAAAIAILGDPERRDLQIVMASNAGAWVQNGGQFRRAMRRVHGHENFDETGAHFSIISDSIEIGYTGTESPDTHQNPYSAVGILVRAAQEMTRHMQPAA